MTGPDADDPTADQSGADKSSTDGSGERSRGRDGHPPGVDALQAAAQDAIKAARALLDVAETLVQDPEVAARIGSVARAAARAARPGAGNVHRPADTATDVSDDDDDGDDGVQRIPVS